MSIEDEMNPLTLGETPEEFIENDDGSVEILLSDEPEELEQGFYDNLAETLPEGVMTRMAGELVDLIEKDREARKDRDKQYEEGIRRTGLGDDAPGGASFDGASKVVHPVMAEATVDFAAAAIKELFPPSGPVRSEFVGDLDHEQLARGVRKTQYMNWQLTKQIPEYYDEMEQLLSQLPLGGSQFLKVRYDDVLARPVVDFVPIDEIILPFSATNFYTAPRATHRQMITQATFEQRVESGFYRDADLFAISTTPDQTATESANAKVEGVEDNAYNEDGLRAILEVYTWREIEGDDEAGETAPYVIHIDEYSEKVLAIYRNWQDDDELREKLDWVVEFKFIPWRGAYAIGLPHLIGGLSAALTGALRALLDSAHINNAASMLKLKSGRVVGQNTKVEITQVTDIEAPANVDDIRKVAMPMPFNPPSTVLFQMLGFLTEAAKGVISTAEEKISDAGNQMPVGTAMALIEQGSKVFSSIHARLHRSQAKVLSILHRLNSQRVNTDEQVKKLGKVLATVDDFQGSLDVIPASDPNIFSETQRYAQIQALLQMSQDSRVQWNMVNIYKRMLHLMHVQNMNDLLEIPDDPFTGSAMEENDLSMQNKPIEADIAQDHMEHIQTHLIYASAPWIVDNPMIDPKAVAALLQHVNSHMLMHYKISLDAIQQQGTLMGIPVEAGLAPLQQNIVQLQQIFTPVMQTIGQLQQKLQKRTPPPPMPPEVQASIQVAEMEIKRKTAQDQAAQQADSQNLQLKQQAETAKLQLAQATTQFEQNLRQQEVSFSMYMDQQSEAARVRAEEMSHKIELIKNDQDNHQKQMTELLKNRDDNQTKLLIEQIKGQMASEASALDAVNSTLDEIGNTRTDQALAEIKDVLAQPAVE